MTLSQLFPDYPRRAVLLVLCLALVHQIMPGGVDSMDSLWRFVPDRLAVPGMVPGGARIPRKCTTSQKLHQNWVGLNRKNPKKNRRNLRLIQTCDFFILCILYIIFYNVPRRDVNFYFITFNSSFLMVFFLLVISEILLLRFFCRLVSLLLRFADSLLTVPMATPFRTSPSCSDSVN